MGRVTVAALLVVLIFTVSGCGKNDTGETRSSASTDSPPSGDARQSRFAGLPPGQVDEIMASFNRGMGLMDQYQPDAAASAFGEVVRLAPDWPIGRLNLGVALLNVGSDEAFARAEQELRKVIAVDPANPYAHYALGMLLRHLSRFGEARAEFERVLEIDPDDAGAHYQLAVLIIDDDPQEARRHLEIALEKMPHNESVCYRLQALLRNAGEQDKAREVLLRFTELKSTGAGVGMGMKYGEMGHYAYVERAFEEPAVDGGPSTPPVFEDVAGESGLALKSTGVEGWPGEGSGATRPSFGPGAACADVDGDGDLDLFVPGLGPDGRGALYLNQPGGFTRAATSGIDGRHAIAAYFGDYDGDGDPDLYLTCDGPNKLYRNDRGGSFADVTASSGAQGLPVVSVGAAWADADHDGDLDLYVANYSPSGTGSDGSAGARNALWRNNGDGTFTDVASDEGVDGGDAHTTGVLFFDVDDDRDLDLYVINDREANQLFLNDRIGRYRNATPSFPGLDDDGPGLGALLGDVDSNGMEDVLLLRGPEPPRLFVQTARGRYAENSEFSFRMRSLGGAVGGLLADIDLDGDLDLVLLDAGSGGKLAHAIEMNRGGGHFGPPVTLGQEHAKPNARGALAADLNGDGSLELFVATANGRPELWRSPPPQGRHWLSVIPTQGGDDGSKWVDPDAVGLSVEVKTGRYLQVASVISGSGYLGNPPPMAHFGLGDQAKADYVRLSWPDAVLQGELEVPADQAWRITKASRKPSSCPILFSWDGERFAFVTDFLGVGGVGFFMTPGEYGPPDPTEDVRIPPELVSTDHGRCRLRVAEPLEEVTYLDELHLIAYDHPGGWELYPDERFGGPAPAPTGRPHAIEKKIFPVGARDDGNEDVLNSILHIDRRYVEPPKDDRFIGYARDHWIELDFGDRLRDVPPDARLVLCLYGWVEYTYSHVNYAAYQAGLTMRSPSIEIPDGDGGWRVAVPDAGFPAGLPRMMTLDISSLPIREDGRIRIRSNMEVYWDQIFVGRDVAAGITAHTMDPVSAELRYLGYPREYSPDGADPTLYDYDRADPGLPFKNLTGDFTRFGDVRALLNDVDDRFVVMGHGEEIALEFDTTGLPELPRGWSRTFVLHADGYCKDMDLYTAYPDSVEPLPYHAMENYPPVKPIPDTKSYQEYRRTWNTRRIVGSM